MSEWLQALFASIFGSNSWLATLIISMIPIVELRGAIPFGASVSFWNENALSLWASFGISVAGSSFICVVLTFLFFPIFNWLKRTKGFKKLAGFVERKLSRKSKNIEDKTKEEKNKKRALILKMIGVFGFVAVPLPLTGVWTGTCLALFIGLNKWQTLVSVLTGNVVAGLLMTLISLLFAGNTAIVLYAFLILVVIFILIEVIRSLVLRAKEKKQNVINNETELSANKASSEESKQDKTLAEDNVISSKELEGNSKIYTTNLSSNLTPKIEDKKD